MMRLSRIELVTDFLQIFEILFSMKFLYCCDIEVRSRWIRQLLQVRNNIWNSCKKRHHFHIWHYSIELAIDFIQIFQIFSYLKLYNIKFNKEIYFMKPSRVPCLENRWRVHFFQNRSRCSIPSVSSFFCFLFFFNKSIELHTILFVLFLHFLMSKQR